MSSGDKNNPDPVTAEQVQKLSAIPLVQQNLRRQHMTSREYDIPYVAGYSVSGATIYIDKDMPTGFMYRGKKLDTDRFLILHEEWEKALIDAIKNGDPITVHTILIILKMSGPDDDIYYHTHGVATFVEEAAVSMVYGSQALGPYNAFMKQHIKTTEDQTIQRVPEDLDLTPYTSSEDAEDRELLQVMKRRMID